MQTPRLWLACSFAVACTLWTRAADATITPSADPVLLGSHVVLTTGNTTVTLTKAGATPETLQSLQKAATADCGAFTLTPAPALPQVMADTDTNIVSVAFVPGRRGAFSCVVTMLDPVSASYGTFTLQGTGVAPELSVSVVSLDFSGTPVAGGTVQRMFDIQNTSNDAGQNLTITSVVISGPQAADYSLSAAPGSPIAPGGAFTMTLTFNPSAAGTRTATVTVTASNDPIDTTETVSLTGVGQIPIIGFTNDPLTFSPNVLAGASANQNLTVINNGDTNLTVNSATIAGGAGWIVFTGAPLPASCNGQSSCDFAPDPVLTPAATRNITLRCQPPLGASGLQTATVTFTSDTVGGDSTALVNCTAVRPNALISPLSFDYGSVLVAGGTAMTTITLTNTGTSVLTYQIANTNSAEFTYPNPQCTAPATCTLGAGLSRPIVVTFNPTADGARTANLTFTSDDQDPGDTMIQVVLDGVGDGAEILRTTPSPIMFGPVTIGTTSAAQPITFFNDGNTDLTISALSMPNAVFQFSPAVPQTIPPLTSRTFNVTCSPIARTTYSGNAVATNNSWNNGALPTMLTCQGVKPDLQINMVDSLIFDFGGVAEGSMVTQMFTLRNFGEQPAMNITSSLSNTLAGYTFMGIPTSLAPGGMQTFSVTFAPTMTATGGVVFLDVNADPQDGGTLNLIEDAQLELRGQGLSNGIDVDTPITFADTRWDQTSTLTFDIRNTAQSQFNVTALVLSNTNDYAITQIQIDSTGDGTFETTQASFSTFMLCGSNAGGGCPGVTRGRARVTVRFQPNNMMLGLQTGMVTVTCNLPSDNVRVVLLSGTSTSPSLTVEPGMTVNFGPVDVDAGAAMQMLRLRNTTATTGTMDVLARNPTPIPAPFSAPVFAPGTIGPGASHDTTFSFDPTLERSAATPESTVVTFTIDGIYDMVAPNENPTGVMITLQGYGTDRHIQVGGPVIFPPTYRNPTTPPEMDVTVMNTGEAPLVLSAAMLNGDPAFTIVSGMPVTVQGMQTATFRIRFTPMMVGSFGSLLQIMHDDNAVAPIAEVMVTGMGIDREMTFSPTLALGTSVVGEELHRADLIELVNMSPPPGSIFRVHELRVLDASGVVTVEPAADRMVAAGATERFDVTFTPAQAGPYMTDVEIYLDDDPVALGHVTLTGHAVEIGVRGGGCSTSGGGEAGGALVIVALALGLRRRRHALAAVACVGAALALVPAANADVTAQSFHPLPSIEDDLFAVESATVGKANAWAAGLAFTYAADPLISTVTNCGGPCPTEVTLGEDTRLVKAQSVIVVGGAYAIANRFEVGLTVPVLVQSGDDSMFGGAASGTTLGDVAVHGKMQLVKLGRIAVGAGAIVTAPTARVGKANQYAGYSGPSGQGLALVSYRGRRLLISANLGFLGRKTEQFAMAVQQGSAVTFGGGVGYRVLPPLWVAAEAFGDYGVVKDSQPSAQALAGLRYRVGDAFTLGLGGGFGLTDGVGVPKARGFVLLAYSPQMRPQEAFKAPPPPRDERDFDNDGVVNADDKCKEEAEDVDLYDDKDGCPDYDNDNDNVADGADACKEEAEDVDGFQDADGCPDPDNDGDGVPDQTDACPNDVEDKDGNADLDGCPDDDNDHDGVIDSKDKCPAQAETINGNSDDDGCPDRGDSLVLLAAERIELLEPIKFNGATAKLNKASHNVLGQVAATLRANPEILRLRVTAHVHPRDSRDKDQKLSDDRAAAVKEWLVLWGIKIERVDAKGFGSQKPLVKNQRRAEEINDRIEFVIMEKK